MILNHKIVSRLFTSLVLSALLLVGNQAIAVDGEALFKANCASCQKADENYTGPML